MGEWEGGRRFPTAAEFLRVCRICGIDVSDAFTRFHPTSAAALGVQDDAGVAAWLTAIRGQASVTEIARRLGMSRTAVSRAMSGAARPRLPMFLALVEACSGRVADLVGALVPVERVPSVAEAHQRATLARRLLFDHPWATAVWSCLQTRRHEARSATERSIARSLGISRATVAACLGALVDAGIVVWSGTAWAQGPGRLVVDTDAVPEGPEALKRHWSTVALERLGAGKPEDQFGYAVFGVSEADLVRLRELHRAYYRQVRAIAAHSEPTEVVALLNLQLVELTA